MLFPLVGYQQAFSWTKSIRKACNFAYNKVTFKLREMIGFVAKTKCMVKVTFK